MRLALRDFVLPGEAFHLAASLTIVPGYAPLPHTHDFYEVCYVESGFGHHWINGEKQPFHAGWLALVRDRDMHALTANEQEVALVNLAFSKASWNALLRRYFKGLSDPMLLPCAQRTRRLWIEDQNLLRRAVARMANAERSAARLDHFLMDVVWIWTRFRDASTDKTQAAPPDWLLTALRSLSEPQVLHGGTRAMAKAAHRSPEHLARASHRWFGKSPTQMLNEARMKHAAHLLSSTPATILDVAHRCGVSNLGHFYKLFVAAHDCTPRLYREKQRGIVGGAPGNDAADQSSRSTFSTGSTGG